MHISLNILVIGVVFTEHGLAIIFISVTLCISQETWGVFDLNHSREQQIIIFLAIFFIDILGQTESFKIFKQEAVHVAPFDQLGIGKPETRNH